MEFLISKLTNILAYEKCIQTFNRKNISEQFTWKTCVKFENNIKMNL